MIVKKREIPLFLLKLKALLRRLPPQHPKFPVISEDFKKRQSGYNGECSIDYQLSFLDETKYSIFHDIRLQDQTHFFQIDTLLMSTKFALIIEVKNIAGTLYFDPLFEQLIRTKDGEETAFPNPIHQVQRQELQLRNWFAAQRLKEVPIFSLVVISNPQTIIQTAPSPTNLPNKVIHRNLLPTKINQFENKIKAPILTEKELKKGIRLLQKHHTEADVSILERYQISSDELINGVFCPSCESIPLTKIHGAWLCQTCQTKSKDAHFAALNDFKLLIGPNITNGQMREFLHIPTMKAASRLLLSMNLPYTGAKKNRIYQL
ncbi:nuclease-related domain-containing protein [Ectobacillus sp. sgz5001026]|uniref:nuclease-related domain-containing protein n=1 Tax=Ectobacillus sp. sgz5001026 TaxID=3242473 RepID=UPI0036D26A19